jgi:hypothetical protein
LSPLRYKEMLELVISPSLTANSHRKENLRLSGDVAAAGPLSDREGRLRGEIGAQEVGSVHPQMC